MKKEVRQKIILWFIGGFVLPPLFWIIIIWFNELFNSEQILKIVSNPGLLIYIPLYIILMVILLSKKLQAIEEASLNKDYEEVQRLILNIISLYIIGITIYCLIGPNTGLMGLDINRSTYLLSWSFGIPIIFIFTLPFFLKMIFFLEAWTSSVPLADTAKVFTLKTKLFMCTTIASVGVIILFLLSFKSLLYVYSGSTIQKELTSNFINKGITVGVMGFITIIVPVIIIIRRTTNDLTTIQQLARKITGGNLTFKLFVESRDDVGRLATSLINMSTKLTNIIESIHNGISSIASASQQVSNTSQNISQSANEQASSVEEVSSTMEEMAINIQKNAENSSETEKIALVAREGIQKVSNQSQESVNANKQISDKISIINDISFQTNILALNAAVEAARAGEHGKGFAVVAAEVRKLAERSKLAAEEIIGLTKNSHKLAVTAGTNMDEILPEVVKTAKLIQEISSSSQEQNNGVDAINNAIQQLNGVTQQNAAASEELATSAEEMTGQADQLKDLVSFFTVNNT